MYFKLMRKSTVLLRYFDCVNTCELKGFNYWEIA
jgi:hypothetical protein